jgi:hypothetical protein
MGWGVQSTTLAFMSALGELPKLDYVIHSDTTWEREETYKYAEEYTPFLEQHGIKIITTSDPKTAQAILNPERKHSLYTPVFTQKEGASYKGDRLGKLRRTCTDNWKIQPLKLKLREILAELGLKPTDGVIQMWLGISKDEWHRAKNSEVKYIENEFPLLDKKMSRNDCVAWLKAKGFKVPKKFSCSICVFHSEKVWDEMKRENGKDWETAVWFDNEIRDLRPGYVLFLHKSGKPLEQAVNIPEDQGQVQSEMFGEDLLEEGGCKIAGFCGA